MPFDPIADTRAFFDDMARTYDRDIHVVGWDPVDVMRRWPFAPAAGARVLCAGCGTGIAMQHLSQNGALVDGFDLSPKMVRRASIKPALQASTLKVHSAGTAPWPFQSSRYDHAVCMAVLEFVPDLGVALDALHDVLRPGGTALVSIEDRIDMHGNDRGPQELRYGEFPLWRRDRAEVEAAIGDGLAVDRWDRGPGYTVVEHGWTTAYWYLQLQRTA